MTRQIGPRVWVAALAVALAGPASAATLRASAAGHAGTLDPHSQNIMWVTVR